MKAILLAAALALPLGAGLAQAEPASPKVQAFAQDATLSNMFEITESKIALQKSSDPAVRDFARQMIHDHTMAQMMLHEAAQPSGVVTGFMFDGPRQAQIDMLSGKSGADFDSAYWADQRDAHSSAVASVSDYAASGEDPALRHWAMTALPVIQMHQRMIMQMTGM